MPKTQLKPALTFLAVLAVVLVVLVPFRAQTRDGATPTERTRVVAPSVGSGSAAGTASSRRTSSGRATDASAGRATSTSGGLFAALDRASTHARRSDPATRSVPQTRRAAGSARRSTRDDSGTWSLQQALDRLGADLRRR